MQIFSPVKTCGVAGLFSLVFIAGCGSSLPLPEFHKDLVPVSGTITLKNKPLAGASVSFIPQGTTAVSSAYAKTDEAGRYALMTPIHGLSVDKTKGAVPGDYFVVISKLKMPDGSDVPAGLTEADAMQQGAKETIPAKYRSEERTSLKTPVKAATPLTDLNFDLL